MFDRLRKKSYFKSRIEEVDRAIWNLEFSRAKLKMIREGVRQQYDRLNEMRVGAEQALEAEKKSEAPDSKKVEHFTKLVEKYSPDVEYMKKQMEGLENAISTEATDEKGNPVGLNKRIEAARTMKEMLSEYRKEL